MEDRTFHKAPEGGPILGVWLKPGFKPFWEWQVKKAGRFLSYQLIKSK